MKVVIGSAGVKTMTWQKAFPKTMDCPFCHKRASSRIAMTAIESGRSKNKIHLLHKNRRNGKFWPHDRVAFSLYFCGHCARPSVIYNQA